MRQNRLKPLFGLVLLAVCATTIAQGDKTLADYLAKNNPNPTGAALSIEPDRVHAEKDGDSLQDFHRIKVVLGNLAAVVPDKMVVIDDSFQQQPDLYDGLDRRYKVLYLLSTLNGGQWDLISKGGIGMADLDDAQKRVFVSLMPTSISWHSFSLGDDGRLRQELAKGEVKGADLANVRLYVRRQMDFHVKVAGTNGVTDFREASYGGSPGATIFARIEDHQNTDAFGVKARKNVDNETKPSNLDYSAKRLKTPVKLPQPATVNDLLAEINSATGYEIHADLRVANRQVWLAGTETEAGQLLKALALAVTGTYRRVGSAYVLTSDLIGLGTRKLRFALWSDDLRDRQRKLGDGWQATITASGRIKGVGFPTNDPVAATGALSEKLEEGDANLYFAAGPWVPSGEMTAGMRSFLSFMASRSHFQSFDLSSAQLKSTYNYGYVLPTGEQLKPEPDDIGFAASFRSRPAEKPSLEDEATAPLPIQTVETPMGMMAAPTSANDAEAWVRLAARKGFSELWIKTIDGDILRHALAAGAKANITIKLAVLPWSSATKLPALEVDRTQLGETKAEVLARENGSDEWRHQVFRRYDPAAILPLPDLSPTDALREKYWSQLLAMGRTPGLGGVVLLQTAPFGYEGKRNSTQRELSPAMIQLQTFGFTTAQRLAFLRAKSVDPIDISTQQLSVSLDLRQPFFASEAVVRQDGEGEGVGMSGVLTDWDAYLGDLNSHAIQDLASSLSSGGLQVQVEARDELINMVDYYNRRYVSAWSAGSDLPISSLRGPVPPGVTTIREIPLKDLDDPVSYRPSIRYINTSKQHASFDFARMSIHQAGTFLDGLVADKAH